MASGLLTRAQLAERLGVSYLTVEKWSYTGVLSFAKVGNSTYYDPRRARAELRRWERARFERRCRRYDSLLKD